MLGSSAFDFESWLKLAIVAYSTNHGLGPRVNPANKLGIALNYLPLYEAGYG